MKSLFRADAVALVGLWLALVLAGSGGCAAVKAVDSTVAIERLTAAETHTTYTLLPAELVNDPELAGKVLALPTAPGKNVRYKSYYPDGQTKMELTTERSPVIDALWAGANSADAAKFAQDQWQAQHWSQFAERMVAQALSLRAALVAESARATSAPAGQWQDQIKALLAQALQAALERQGLTPAPATP